jgi:Tol biopolymer transport system component
MRMIHGILVGVVALLVMACDCGAGEPEGSWITFLSRRSGENVLYKMRPDGSEVTPIFGGELQDVPGIPEGATLYREPHWARLSPDRKFFLDWADDVKLPRDKFILPRFMIHLGRLDGGPTRAIAPDGEESFAWAPDSRRFGYVRSWRLPHSPSGVVLSSPLQIVIVGIDGANEEVVLERPYPEAWAVLDWSPDGKRLLLIHQTTIDLEKAEYVLYELDLAEVEAMRRVKQAGRGVDDRQEGTVLKPLTKERSRFLVGRYSPDGKRVAVLISRYRVRPGERFDGKTYRESVELATVDASTGELRAVVKYPGEGLHAPLCWSPDGGEILFSRSLKQDDRREDLGPGEPGLGIWAIRPDGTNARFLTTGWCADWR